MRKTIHKCMWIWDFDKEEKWVYFRKKASDGAFELFSDNASRVKYLTRIINFILVLAGLNLYIGAYNMFLVFMFDSSVNLLGILNLAIGIFAIIGTLKLIKKRKIMKQEGQLFE